MFKIQIVRKDKSVSSPVSVRSSATGTKRPRGAWRSDPISPKQLGTIASMFRRKGMVQDVNGTPTVSFAGLVFTYDETLVRPGKGGAMTTGGWTGLSSMTKGEASDLMDKLHAIPDQGFGPVTEAQAEPVAAAPKAAPKKRGETITVDGITYRIAGIAR